MTKDEKRLVADLQAKGMGYKKIASVTGLGLNTVKSYCQRHPVEGQTETEADGYCANCGKPLERTPTKKAKRFCCDACRMSWWNRHPEKVTRKAFYSLTCRHCGRPFESYGNAKRKYCCRLCYDSARRKEAANG